ncbi:hypothetical protein IFR04_016003 [Cadophora malorum]|uniref:Uncharacterized protein n=1 Tax=Cadophora malorum TaxID=108018 RepID=A0A8H7T1T6_9HELO|nr:hypothetical protein IFR04_016003 [Cadophora malorum]
MKLSRYVELVVLLSLTLSSLFSILLLTSGYKNGVLNKLAIAQYSYNLNSTAAFPPSTSNSSLSSSSTSPVLTPQEITDGIHWWVFTAHYLSICAGYVGGSPIPLNVFLECKVKPLGYTFRTDDPFIVSFQRNGSLFPVESIPLDIIRTKAPCVMLVLGIVFLGLSLVLLGLQWIDKCKKFPVLVIILLALVFMLTSAALITSVAGQRRI